MPHSPPSCTRSFAASGSSEYSSIVDANSFGGIFADNRRILVMEWIAEGVTHISVGALVIIIAAVDGSADATAELVYRVLAVVLIALAVLTTFTGARTPVVWFKVCPFVLTGAAAPLLAASAL